MEKKIVTDKYFMDKIILLGVFAVSLLCAYFIVISRSAILLSSPIKLGQAGLSVKMPSGNGWNSEKNWQYIENSFVLNSFFAPSSAKAEGIIQCRYSLSDQNEELETFFSKKAEELGGKIIKTGQRVSDNLTADWILVKNPKLMSNIVFGIIKLQPSRTLYIEAHQLLDDQTQAERVFTKVVESIKFENNALLRNGIAVLETIKERSISNVLENQNLQSYLLIKDVSGKATGFCVSVVLDTGDDSNLPIQAASHIYLREKDQSDNVTFLQTNDSLTGFFWKAEKTSQSGIYQTQIDLDESGSLIVKKTDLRTSVKTYQATKASLPEILLPLIFEQMITLKQDKIVLDVIDNDGNIRPGIISIDPGKKVSRFRIEFSSGQVIYEQADLDTIIKMFPERAELLLHKKSVWQND